MKENYNASWLLIVCLFLPGLANSASTSIVNITGIVQAMANCTVNNGNPVNIEFGNVATDQVNGANYSKPINFTLYCTGLPSPALKVRLTGTGAAFDSTSLSTSVSNLGIAFTDRSGNRMALNTTWQNFNYAAQPVVNAVPVMRAGATLPTGGFTASATLVIEQQ